MKKRLIYAATSCLILLFALFSATGIHAQKIDSISPLTGTVGTPVTIYGSGFAATPSGNIVYFGTVKALVTDASSTQIKVKAPAGATYLPVSVTAAGLTGYSPRPFVDTFGCAGSFTGATLGNTISYDAGFFSSPISIAVADLNGDGKPDLISANRDGNNITIFENSTSNSTIDAAGFSNRFAIATGPGPAGLAIADFNNDGKLDIAVVNSLGSTVSIIQNNSTGGNLSVLNFGPKVDLLTSAASTDSARPANIAVGDLDGDGKTDLAVSNTNKNAISIFHNVSSGVVLSATSFETRFDLPAGTLPLGIAIADIDGDKRPDIICNNSQSSTLSIFKNNSIPGTLNSGSFNPSVDFTTNLVTSSLAVADLTNDGKPEVVVTNYLTNNVSVFRNTATANTINNASLAARVDYPTSLYPVNITIGDITGDGRPDMVVSCWDFNAANSLSNPINIYRNTFTASPFTTSSFALSTYITAGSSGTLGITDLDEDGKPDLIVPNYTSDAIGVLKNNSSSFSGIAASTVNASTSICDDGVWKNIYDPANSARIIAAVKDNGNNLGIVSANVYVDPGPGSYNGNRYLARHFVITAGAQPTQNVRLRLYFTNAELAALQAVDNSASASNLAITKYQGPTEDGQFNPSDATSLITIPPSSIYFGTALGARYAEFTVNSLSEFWLHSAAITLPVNLVAFDATPSGKAVLIDWKTADEVNLEKYVVERSSNGFIYAGIGSVEPLSTGDLKSYHFTDENPARGSNYYRLQQRDKDGKVAYSDVRLVVFNDQQSISVTIAPHPVSSQSVITMNLAKGNNTFSLYDVSGAKVRSYQYSVTGSEVIRLNFDRKGLQSGTYMYTITNAAQPSIHGKLVIQ